MRITATQPLFAWATLQGFSLLGDGPPLSGGYPRRFPAAGTAAGAGAWKGRIRSAFAPHTLNLKEVGLA